MNEALEYQYEIYIGAPLSKVWRGLIDAEMTRKYVYGTRLQTSLKPGAPYSYVADDGSKVVAGNLLEVVPEERLWMTWLAHWDPATASDGPSRVRLELSPAGSSTTKLRVIHDQFEGPSATYHGSVAGWPVMLSSLKSLLETGNALDVQS